MQHPKIIEPKFFFSYIDRSIGGGKLTEVSVSKETDQYKVVVEYNNIILNSFNNVVCLDLNNLNKELENILNLRIYYSDTENEIQDITDKICRKFDDIMQYVVHIGGMGVHSKHYLLSDAYNCATRLFCEQHGLYNIDIRYHNTAVSETEIYSVITLMSSTSRSQKENMPDIFTPEQKEYIDNIEVKMESRLHAFQDVIQDLTDELETKSRKFQDSLLELQQNYQSEIGTIRQAIRNLTLEIVELRSLHVTTDSELPNDLGNPHIVNHGFSKPYPSFMEVFHKPDPRHMNFNKNSENIIDVIAVTQNLLASLNHDFAMMTYIASVENTKLSSQESNTLSAKKAQICERLGALKACINKIENSPFINSDFFNQGVKNIVLQSPLSPLSYKYSWHFGPTPPINTNTDKVQYRSPVGFRF